MSLCDKNSNLDSIWMDLILQKNWTLAQFLVGVTVFSFGLVAEMVSIDVFDVGIFSVSKKANNSLYHTSVFKLNCL